MAQFNPNDLYIRRAKELVSGNFNNELPSQLVDTETVESLKSTPADFYVVWFSKVLRNWKALVSTDIMSGLYYEVTYDGNAKQTYVDFYIKATNVCVPDEDTL